MKKINIVGESMLFNYDEVKNDVVQLSYKGDKKYHWKSSNDLVKVNGRYYRKNSPLIARTVDRVYEIKKDCVRLEEGLYMIKGDDRILEIDGKKYNKANFSKINGKWYSHSDERLVYTQEGLFVLKTDAIELDERNYGKGVFVSKELCYDGSDINEAMKSRYIKTSRGYVSRNDCFFVMDFSKKDLSVLAVGNNDREGELLNYNCFAGVRDKNSPYDLRNYLFARVYAKDEDKIKEYKEGYVIPNYYEKTFAPIWEKYYNAFVKKDVEALRAAMNASFSDRDEDENVAPLVKKNINKYPGGRFAPGLDFRYNPAINNDTRLTGGLKYTFGIELESSAGEVPIPSIKELNVAVAGDGSVGANEYVSGILHGSSGMEEAGKILQAFRKSCLVDDRCGVHIHIGGLDNKNVKTPKFGRDFSISAIKLGTLLERELYMMSPKSRNPKLKYCAGIKNYSGITPENWRPYLGSYIFGRGYEWSDGDEGKELGRWASARYKWLNLVNCCTVGRFKTIEIRLWPGTTSYNKLKNYILLSLAFVNYVDNHQASIWSKKEISLGEVVEAAFGKGDLTLSLEHFIDKRKQAFGRTLESIYK